MTKQAKRQTESKCLSDHKEQVGKAFTRKPRTRTEIRELALALRDHPIPTLTKKQISQRWSVGSDTVRKVLRKFGVDPGPLKDVGIPLTDVLSCEHLDDPLSAWAFGSDEDRLIFEADLLSPEKKRADDTRRSKLHISTYRRHAREGRLISIRIGKQHRFRPNLASAEQWHEMLRNGHK